MAPAIDTRARAAEPPVSPRRARRLNLNKAIDQWAETTRAIERLKVLQKEAAEVLIAHGEKTGRRTFGDSIAMQSTGGSVVLDQAKVREFLGPRLAEFQTRTKRGWSLKLLR